MLHIHDVEGPKKTGSMETRLEAMEQQVFKCQGMVECGLNANHMMITEFTNKHRIDANDIGKHLSRLYDRIDQLQAQIYDLQNQNYGGIVGLMFLSESLEELSHGHALRRRRWRGNVALLLLGVIFSLGRLTGSWLLARSATVGVAEGAGASRNDHLVWEQTGQYSEVVGES
ncbi:40s ribosomal protein s5-1 [Hordeum vulgare]|nr:40s ribosomal protein s5-1 [Hordeum vulgare]